MWVQLPSLLEDHIYSPGCYVVVIGCYVVVTCIVSCAAPSIPDSQAQALLQGSHVNLTKLAQRAKLSYVQLLYVNHRTRWSTCSSMVDNDIFHSGLRYVSTPSTTANDSLSCIKVHGFILHMDRGKAHVAPWECQPTPWLPGRAGLTSGLQNRGLC
jgi:hypothetical protein